MRLPQILAVLTFVGLLLGSALRVEGPEVQNGAMGPFSPTLIFSMIVSLLVLLASLYVILSKKYSAEDTKWAYGSVGAILGFWLG